MLQIQSRQRGAPKAELGDQRHHGDAAKRDGNEGDEHDGLVRHGHGVPAQAARTPSGRDCVFRVAAGSLTDAGAGGLRRCVADFERGHHLGGVLWEHRPGAGSGRQRACRLRHPGQSMAIMWCIHIFPSSTQRLSTLSCTGLLPLRRSAARGRARWAWEVQVGALSSGRLRSFCTHWAKSSLLRPWNLNVMPEKPAPL